MRIYSAKNNRLFHWLFCVFRLFLLYFCDGGGDYRVVSVFFLLYLRNGGDGIGARDYGLGVSG